MILKSEEDTKSFAINLAKTLKAKDIVALYGDLGSGKTFIAREIIRYFCGADTIVSSPTFNILQTYETPNFTIYHYDLYRLKSPQELYELGIEEALNNNLCLIEWPEMVEPILPKPYIKVHLELK